MTRSKTYAVTGAASGMGAAVTAQLRAAGHRVIDVDIQESTVTADLSDGAGRRRAATEVLDACGGRLDGAVLAAGVGPAPGPHVPRLILQVNYLGVTELLEAWQPALAATGDAKVVVFSSNSTTTTPMVPWRAVRALLEGDAEQALRRVGRIPPLRAAWAYAASKIALSHWVRRTAVLPEWAGAGIRLNALAPGAVLTPLLEKQLATPSEARNIRAFPVPVGGFGDPDALASWAVFMTTPAADFLCGSVIFVDGGSDAWFRPDAWPRPVPAHGVPRYLQDMRRFRAARKSAQRD
jgi:NAD(P)-dependent dehydrogenase (short-subunit alcohol dehydrogenase family)